MPSDNEILKMRSGGAITPKEAERLLSMPKEARYRAMQNKALKERSGAAITPREREMVKPEKAKGGPPKRIGEGMNEPGGPMTPGAKAKRLEKQKAASAAMRVGSKKIKLKDGKPSNPHRGAYSTGGTVGGAVGGGT